MNHLLKFFLLYDPEKERLNIPMSIILIIGGLWIIFCAAIFSYEKEMSFRGKALFAVMSLWILLRMTFYRGRYRPRFLAAMKILWLPMAVLFLLLKATGNL